MGCLKKEGINLQRNIQNFKSMMINHRVNGIILADIGDENLNY